MECWVELSPDKIRFTQNSISYKFSNGNKINKVIEEICSGFKNVNTLPYIKVVERNGSYYTFDNRHLYVYRVLHLRGRIDSVNVKLCPLSPCKFTTKNNGKSIKVRGDVTLPNGLRRIQR